MPGASSKTRIVTFRLPNEVFDTISKRLLSSTNSSSSVPDYCRRAVLLRIYAKHKGGRRLKELQICTCLQCGYQWNCKITEPPKRCASCCTHSWNKPKMRNQGRPMKCFGDTKLTGAGDESMKIDEDEPHPSPLLAIEGLRK